mgnify:FL=1
MNLKIKSLREKMKLQGLQGMIIENPINIRYLIGIPAEGTILITDKENIFITDARYIEEVTGFLTINDEFIVLDVRKILEEDYINFFKNCEHVGFEENYITYSRYKEIIRRYRIQDKEETEKILEKQRMIKDEKEINNIKKACEITDRGFDFLVNYIKRGMTERRIALELQKFFLSEGADGIAFETIVASGANSSKPHAVPENKEVREGDIITIDFGAKYNGYVADMTRTIFVGNITDETKRLYNLVLQNQLRSIKEMKVGTSCKMLARNVDSDFYLYNYNLIHALGHGIGLEVHEMPYISQNSTFTLKENMVVTNEPGIYIKGKCGIRIEDTILITENEPEILTKSSKDIIII